MDPDGGIATGVEEWVSKRLSISGETRVDKDWAHTLSETRLIESRVFMLDIARSDWGGIEQQSGHESHCAPCRLERLSSGRYKGCRRNLKPKTTSGAFHFMTGTKSPSDACEGCHVRRETVCMFLWETSSIHSIGESKCTALGPFEPDYKPGTSNYKFACTIQWLGRKVQEELGGF